MRLALYTTIYPGVERFLGDWFRSVQEQSDQDFHLWIGLDSMSPDAAMEAMGGDLSATWVPGEPGDSPAQIRQRAFSRLLESCDGVVMVDSDDVLHPSRVAAARDMLGSNDLVGCALGLIDEQGDDLGITMGLPPDTEPGDILPRNNIFGLSNTAFRTDLLRRCLPIPAEVVLVDWFLVTHAWLCDARLMFDSVVRMGYRQHGANTARVRSPFGALQVAEDTELVRRHFRAVQTLPPEGARAERLATVAEIAADVDLFHREVVSDTERLGRYVEALNELEIAPLWWSCVAHPLLRQMWTSPKETA